MEAKEFGPGLRLVTVPNLAQFLTKGIGYVTINAAITELEAHPEGWRDRPDEAPATNLRFNALVTIRETGTER
jgi:hypothetical protein